MEAGGSSAKSKAGSSGGYERTTQAALPPTDARSDSDDVIDAPPQFQLPPLLKVYLAHLSSGKRTAPTEANKLPTDAVGPTVVTKAAPPMEAVTSGSASPIQVGLPLPMMLNSAIPVDFSSLSSSPEELARVWDTLGRYYSMRLDGGTIVPDGGDVEEGEEEGSDEEYSDGFYGSDNEDDRERGFRDALYKILDSCASYAQVLPLVSRKRTAKKAKRIC
jgi:hypothetical protein